MLSIVAHNILCAVVTTGITFSIALLLTFLKKNNSISREASRKVTHIGAGTLHLMVYFYDDRGIWSRYLNVFPNLLWTCILLQLGRSRPTAHSPTDFVTGIMTRNQRRGELLRGPLVFNLVMITCGTVFYKTVLASMIMGVLTWGDGLAAVVGVRYGNNRRIYQNKSLDGSVTVFIAGLIASMLYTGILVNFQSVQIVKMSVVCLVATLVEIGSPSDWDNLTIPLSIVAAHAVIF